MQGFKESEGGDGSNRNLGPQEGGESELLEVVKVSNSLKDIANAGKDAREAVGYGLRRFICPQ